MLCAYRGGYDGILVFYASLRGADSRSDDRFWEAVEESSAKEINAFYGYRTSMSMKNADTWAYAHRYCGKIWYICGWVLLIPSVVLMLLVLGRDEDTVGNTGLILCLGQIVPLLLSIIPTERALRKNFDKKGRRRVLSPKGGRGGVEVPAGRREMQKGGDKRD